MAGPDYILNLSSHGGGEKRLRQQGEASPPAGDAPLTGRPWVAVRWRCCSTYSRVYRNHDATAYEGRCPKCRRPIRLAVGPGGTDQRFFETM